MEEEISQEEAFHNGFHYFMNAVETLSEPAEKQCEIMGYYNVAWEIKDDVSSGIYLLDIAEPYINENQKLAIKELIKELGNIPSHVIGAENTKDGNLESMRHPAWEPLRKNAAKLIKLLEPVIEKNNEYFN